MELAAIIFNVVAVPALLVGLCLGIRQLAQKHVPLAMLRLWIYPGTAVHELSHAFACIPALASVQQVVLFRADGSGEVQHSPSRLGRFGDMLIGMAPFAGGLAALWLLNLVLGNPLTHAGAVSGDGAASFLFIPTLFQFAWVDLTAAVSGFRPGDWRTWVMIYMAVSISLALVPSGQDFKNAAPGIVLVILGLVAWVVTATLLGAANGGSAGQFCTWILGFSHIVLFYFAVTAVVMLVFGLIGRGFAAVFGR